MSIPVRENDPGEDETVKKFKDQPRIYTALKISQEVGPFQVLYAGKAHPQDLGGKEIIKRIFQAGEVLKKDIRIAYLENYEDVGRLSLFLFLVPIFGLGLAALVFGEKVNFLEIIGIIFTVAGIGAVISESWRSRPSQA